MSIHFTDDHEWIAIDGELATVGITSYARSHLGDLVFVQLPRVGTEVEQGERAAVVKSVRAASDLLSPLSGTIIEVNTSVSKDLAIINLDPMGSGWLFRFCLSEPVEISTLLNERTYQTRVR